MDCRHGHVKWDGNKAGGDWYCQDCGLPFYPQNVTLQAQQRTPDEPREECRNCGNADCPGSEGRACKHSEEQPQSRPPAPDEISRYDGDDGYPNKNGRYVLYSDHIRAYHAAAEYLLREPDSEELITTWNECADTASSAKCRTDWPYLVKKVIANRLVVSRRAPKEKTLEERVTIEYVSTGCYVCLDSSRKGPHLNNDIEASIYRRGLIEELRERESKS